MVDLGDVDEWGGGSDRVVCVVDVVNGVVCEGIVMKLNVRMPKEKRKKEKETSKHERVENGFEIVATYSLIILANVLIMAMADFSYVYIVISFNSLVVRFHGLFLCAANFSCVVFWCFQFFSPGVFSQTGIITVRSFTTDD